MAELFRFIQQAFVVPADTYAIDLTTRSPFQDDMRAAIRRDASRDELREQASHLLDQVRDGTATAGNETGAQWQSSVSRYAGLRDALLELCGASPLSRDRIERVVHEWFGHYAQDLVNSSNFQAEKTLASDTLVAVKLTTGFDRVETVTILAMRRVVAFLEDFAAGLGNPVPDEWVRFALERRPVRVPTEFLPPRSAAPTPSSPSDPSSADTDPLVGESDALRRAYDTLMAVRPGQLEVTTGESSGSGSVPKLTLGAATPPGGFGPPPGGPADPQTGALGVSSTVLSSLDPVVHQLLQNELGNLTNAPLTDVLDVIKQRMIAVARVVEPLRVPQPARTYRIGDQLFAVQKSAGTDVAQLDTVPDFSHAVTRPVGIGDLQVVRQTLTGYVPVDVSHIENVLPGELISRTTRREESTELTVIDENETTQGEERDTQSTQRNELGTEARKEATRQSSTSGNQTSTSEYGGLVENSKSNYARSVTDRAVSTVTATVRQQRVTREKKVFTETMVHQIDNSQGQRPVHGVYQWVDKRYRAGVYNYGKRLLYDVVVPEPAAFLIDALKNGAQPEIYQLRRPIEPSIGPRDLNAANYAYWAAQYGVTGAVKPPPEELVKVFSHPSTKYNAADTEQKAYGKSYYPQYFESYTIPVPDDYSAIGGYVQRTNLTTLDGAPESGRRLEFFIGESAFLRFETNSFLNKWFVLGGETGELGVTVCSFSPVAQFNYVVAIKCRRTDSAYAQWQLTTHAQIVGGYNRQRAEYVDELSRYQAAVRTQMAKAHGSGRDDGIAAQELKRSFVHLLMSEHADHVDLPTPDPSAFPTDPQHVKAWGAVAAFFERAFEWEHLMYVYYPYFWGRQSRWSELILLQDTDPEFEAFLKAGAARVVVPVRPGFEAALAHFHETGDVWMGEELPDIFGDQYVPIIAEIKARNADADQEVLVDEWEVQLPTTLVVVRDDARLPAWEPEPRRLAARD